MEYHFYNKSVMASIPKRVADRLSSATKRFQDILASAKSRDVNESDTVIIITDMLAEVFGFDKYSELTSEFAIRGTACDLAVRFQNKIHALIEVKAIGIELKDAHLKQVVDYAANQGVDWVVLTNGQIWRIYKVLFSKPINQELVSEIDFLRTDIRSEEDISLMFLLSREGWQKSVLEDYHNQKQALSRFTIAAMLLSNPVMATLRRELRKLSPDVRIDSDQIREVLVSEVLKRDVMEGEKSEEAKKKVQRFISKLARSKDDTEAPKLHPSMNSPENAPQASPLPKTSDARPNL
jgi:predicted type IV restriction endonuclease